MRMKQSRIAIKYLRNKTVTKDSEGVTSETWGDPIGITCEFWSSSSSLEREISGQYLNDTKQMRLCGSYEIVTEGNHEKYVFDGFSIREGDGICLYTNSSNPPDYIVVGADPERFLLLTLAKRWQ